VHIGVRDGDFGKELVFYELVIRVVAVKWNSAFVGKIDMPKCFK